MAKQGTERERKTDSDGNIIGEDGNTGGSPLDGLKTVLGENIVINNFSRFQVGEK